MYFDVDRKLVNPSSPTYDTEMTYLLPGNERTTLSKDDLICKSAQEQGNQTNGYPALKASPGEVIALRYRENGHITKTTADKMTFGAVSVYGTVNSKPADQLSEIHHIWNANNTGGDQRGRLLVRQSFDDGACYELNDSALSMARAATGQPPHDALDGTGLACKVEFTLPIDVGKGGLYTVYWVWDWPSNGESTVAPGVTKEQYYTSCLDIQIV